MDWALVVVIVVLFVFVMIAVGSSTVVQECNASATQCGQYNSAEPLIGPVLIVVILVAFYLGKRRGTRGP